ncbi:MAG TPA: ScyD/ScyE family protein [Gaiellaceae bacterium]|nr:ScyD/ScyE family protein [Gaiellaceae bacterium]
MTRRLRISALAGLLAAAMALTIGLGTGTAARGTSWTVTPLATGLDSPAGLALTSSGALLVAEGGHGGDVCTPAGALGQRCLGTTGQISKVDVTTGAHTPLVTGLYSRSVTLEGITGVDGVAMSGTHMLATITAYAQELDGATCDGQPADCTTVLAAAKAQAGRLIEFTPSGTWKAIADVGGSDNAWAGAHPGFSTEPPNGNPYGLFGIASGTYVADAGANLVDFIGADGAVHVASALVPPSPPIGFPADTVPTCVTVLRGNLYVASLSGHLWKRAGAFAPTAEVAVADSSGKPLLHHVTGCVSDPKSGAIYLVDMWATPGPPVPAGPGSAAGTGSVVRLGRDGAATVIASGLDFPNGIALAPNGSVYVSVGSICTAVGTPFPYCAHGGGIVRIAP